MESDRREFLKTGARYLLLTFGGGAALETFLAGKVAGLPESNGAAAATVAASSAGYELSKHWWAMIIDIEKCIGCGNCVRACKRENDVPLEPFYFRTWVERYHVPRKDQAHLEAEDSPEVDSPNGGYDGFPERYRAGDGSKTFFVPKMCNHCAHSPCVQVCPVGATFESPDGVVLIDKTYCLGCRYCIQACPYGCRFLDPRTRTADKCTLCYHRITKGFTTACCETCPTGARTLGDLKNPSDPIHEFLATHKVQVLKPQMATGAKAYYNGLDASVR
jgi:Fe-S-cluster-containing dehydrogenase component